VETLLSGFCMASMPEENYFVIFFCLRGGILSKRFISSVFSFLLLFVPLFVSLIIITWSLLEF
jgi:hypothetical protein